MAREHRTPLKRVSHGSLSALARSTGADNGPTGLDFLEPAFAEFADEAAAMHRNIERMGDLYETLETFNESFSSFLYALNMNAYTVEWPQAPRPDISFKLGEDRAGKVQATMTWVIDQPQFTEQAAARAAAQRTPAPSSPPPQPAEADTRESSPGADAETAQEDPSSRAVSRASTSAPTKGRPGAKPKMSAKEKKERVAVEKVINALPLEYRGSEPRLRDHMEIIIGKLMDAPKGLRVTDCVSPPEIPQARANKCLIALVARKVVKKSSAGVGPYTLDNSNITLYLNCTGRSTVHLGRDPLGDGYVASYCESECILYPIDAILYCG
ncbi:DASH complex subunit dam1 domain-containing protein [Rhizoctonia solani AG-1 IA]|uniref:DASH complex subunit DAM1 n=1 Tax=Thanatephorus cucumeris (strain AG1-IA) TaxID=983506 RepID=L8WZ01_THACA|nr:DASH complex subunit dam1 domain-containing protein [Rhizoctonia solani AG-1 IA]